MFRRLLAALRRHPPKELYHVSMGQIEKDGCRAMACSKCSGTLATVLYSRQGQVSAVCSACGCSTFNVEVAEPGI